MGWFTKRKTVLISLIFLIVYFVSYFNSSLGLPIEYKSFCCSDDRMLNLFFISIPIFIISFAALGLKDKTFYVWKGFTFFFILFYISLYFIVPTKGDGVLWIQRESVSFFLTILYSVVSLGLILYKSLKREV